jgi:integrase
MAGRSPKPWFWKKRGAWYVNLRGERVRLGPDKEGAFRTFHLLMARAGGVPQGPKTRRLTLGDLAEKYLADVGRRVDPRTTYVARCYLKPFLAACGTMAVGDLRKHDVEEVIRKHGRWNGTTENHVKSRVTAMLNWGVELGLVDCNPIKGIRKPRVKSRGTRALIAGDERGRLLRGAPPYLRNVLLALHQTGARPCEVLAVEAKHFDGRHGVWVLEEHKTGDVTAKPRIIYLTPQLVALCQELATRHPTGPLFRRASGKPFPRAYYLARLVRNLRRRLGLREGITPYGFRHTFATDALASGVPDAQVAELLGHSGTAMLHKHYSHLTARSRALRDALGMVRGSGEEEREK